MRNRLKTIAYEQPSDEKVFVTRPYLPPRASLDRYLDTIYETGFVTNNGVLQQQLTERLQDYLGVKNLLLVANGTIALQVAYKLMGLQGSVITTPFSFAATTSSLLWSGLKPKFVNIDKNSFNIDIDEIEKNITPDVSAIVPVHVFGNPCEVEKIQAIADRHNLKVIYDAAHCFGVNYQGSSVLNWGDVSILSLHATKLFHSVEGGALVIKDDELYERARRMINFGIAGPDKITEVGINAKMSEFHAAVGHCMLDEFGHIKAERQKQVEFYRKNLTGMCDYQHWNAESKQGCAYMPVMFPSEKVLLHVLEQLQAQDIYPKRYFYPSLDEVSCYQSDNLIPVSRDISRRVLCLPMYYGLTLEHQKQIVNIIRDIVSIK